MALQTSGMISLNDIHIEAGGTTGAAVSLNDTDLRGLTAASGYAINSTAGTAIDFADFYGASSIVTNVLSYTGGYDAAGKQGWKRYGLIIDDSYIGGTIGSNLSPTSTTTSGWGAAMTIKVAACYETSSGGSVVFKYRFEATYSGPPNMTWWETLTISRSGYSNIVLQRSDATQSFSNYRFYLSITAPSGTGYTMLNGSGVTWTFSS
tara:strand:+ start:231 stop:851 length:621 start_codon:yes stop_codon:yes gene_type:complete